MGNLSCTFTQKVSNLRDVYFEYLFSGAKNGISYPALQVAPRQEEPPVDKNAPAEQYHWSVWKSPDTADITQRSPEANRRTNPMIRKTPTIYEHVRNEPENGSQSVLPGNNVEDNEVLVKTNAYYVNYAGTLSLI